ncbi:hypothetical protein IT570_10515 [Candidatus Sumerlaeota bacterium]|nr:hypothetical protein [Candidatus Sumerlaeota bacterium]
MKDPFEKAAVDEGTKEYDDRDKAEGQEQSNLVLKEVMLKPQAGDGAFKNPCLSKRRRLGRGALETQPKMATPPKSVI